MDEINRKYGADDKSSAAAESDEARRARREKERQQIRRGEERKANEEPAFETGFDHGFENMSTFNGKSVGNEGGPAVTSSVANDNQAAQQQPAA